MFGLVIAGGKSSRMGTDKSGLHFKGQTFLTIAKDLLAPFCNKVYVSCSPENQHNFINENLIVDEIKYAKNGPIAAILSAFEISPGPWLILGCDYPLLTVDIMEELIANRDFNAIATTFYHSQNQIAEPLIAIYETRAWAPLLRWFEAGNASMRQFLTQNNVSYIQIKNEYLFQSIDTPELYNKMIWDELN
jgi:molybdopterin-guanine dinucleotide biosynthesis protein A